MNTTETAFPGKDPPQGVLIPPGASICPRDKDPDGSTVICWCPNTAEINRGAPDITGAPAGRPYCHRVQDEYGGPVVVENGVHTTLFFPDGTGFKNRDAWQAALTMDTAEPQRIWLSPPSGRMNTGHAGAPLATTTSASPPVYATFGQKSTTPRRVPTHVSTNDICTGTRAGTGNANAIRSSSPASRGRACWVGLPPLPRKVSADWIRPHFDTSPSWQPRVQTPLPWQRTLKGGWLPSKQAWPPGRRFPATRHAPRPPPFFYGVPQTAWIRATASFWAPTLPGSTTASIGTGAGPTPSWRRRTSRPSAPWAWRPRRRP